MGWEKNLTILLFLLILYVGDVRATEISSCMVINQPGFYVLTQDILNSSASCISIQAENVTLDCKGHVIDGPGNSFVGIDVAYNNTKIKNCVVTDWRIGIRISSSSNVLTNITFLNNSWSGVKVGFSSNNTFFNLSFFINHYGVYLDHSSNNSFTNLFLEINDYGIFLENSSNNSFENVVSSNSSIGIHLHYSHSNELINISSHDLMGVIFMESCRNTLRDSVFNDLFECLIIMSNYTEPSRENLIYNNYFYWVEKEGDFAHIAVDQFNSWNTSRYMSKNIIGGNYTGGNYYWLYSQTCEDSDRDGICDVPFDIFNKRPCVTDCSNNTDYLPLAAPMPLHPCNSTSECEWPLVCVSGYCDYVVPDLNVSFVYYPQTPSKDNVYNIVLRSCNSGSGTNTSISLYENGSLKSSKNISLRNNCTVLVFPWRPSVPGSRTISVMVDPNNTISELNETNNYDLKNVTVLDVFSPVCGNHLDCPVNYYCEGGLCIPLNPCNTSQDCPLGFYCNNSTCSMCFDCEAPACVVVNPECELECTNNSDCAKGCMCDNDTATCVLVEGAAYSSMLMPEFSGPFLILFLVLGGFLAFKLRKNLY